VAVGKTHGDAIGSLLGVGHEFGYLIRHEIHAAHRVAQHERSRQYLSDHAPPFPSWLYPTATAKAEARNVLPDRVKSAGFVEDEQSGEAGGTCEMC
jgi:hypothetical protein